MSTLLKLEQLWSTVSNSACGLYHASMRVFHRPGCASVMAFVGSALDVILLADFSFGDSVRSTLPTEPLLLWLLVLPKLSIDFERGRLGVCGDAMLMVVDGSQ